MGRPFIETVEQKEIVRESAVTATGLSPTLAGKHLSSFNPSLFPFKDYNSQHGIITYLVDAGESFFNLQENKVGIRSSEQNSDSEHGSVSVGYLYRCSTKSLYTWLALWLKEEAEESVVERFGRIYFSDMSSGKVIAVTSSGINAISDIEDGVLL